MTHFLFRRAIGSGFFWGVLALGLVGWNTSGWAQEDLIQRGAEVYQKLRCPMCHQIQGRGRTLGPDLSHVGRHRSREWLFRFLKNPRSVNPNARMFPVKASPEDLEALVTYLMSLK